MGVTINRWTGECFENATACTRYNRLATVNEITLKNSNIVIAKLCKRCLEEAVWEIDNAIFAATGEPA